METFDATALARTIGRAMIRRRNRPVRSKSRWRKTLDKRNPEMVILQADPRVPLMTVRPTTEADRAYVIGQSTKAIILLGTPVCLTAFALNAKLPA